MRALFSRPYPLEPSALQHAIKALLYGSFVAGFITLTVGRVVQQP